MNTMRVFLTAILLALAATGTSTVTASAAVAPAPVSSRSIDVTPVTFAFDGAGRAIASWRGLRGSNPDSAVPFHAVAAAAPDGTWRRALLLSRTVVVHDLALAGGRLAAVVTWREQPARHRRSRSAVVLSLWDTRAARLGRSFRLDLGPARRVTYEGPQPSVQAPRIGASADGDVIVAWQRTFPDSRAGLWTAELRPDGRLVARRRLARRGGTPDLRIAPDGSGLLAWREGRRILARLRATNGRWGPVERVATASTSVTAVESVSPTGAGERFAVAVIQTRRSMDGVQIDVAAHARVPGSGWRSGVLGRYTFVPTGQTAYVTDFLRAVAVTTGDGRVRVVWPDLVDGHIRAAVTDLFPEAGGVGTGPPILLSDPTTDVAIQDASPGPSGRLAATWFDLSDGLGTPSLAEVGAAGAVMMTPRLATERALLGARVAFDPLTGRPTVLWSQGTYPAGYRLVSWTAED